jgi:hypothetical protein
MPIDRDRRTYPWKWLRRSLFRGLRFFGAAKHFNNQFEVIVAGRSLPLLQGILNVVRSSICLRWKYIASVPPQPPGLGRG